MKKLMIVAGEISGDLYGSDLIQGIHQCMEEVTLFGVGGPKMEEAGMELLYNSSCWGTIGLVEAFKKLPRLYFVYRRLLKLLKERRPDMLVLIDYPGLNMRLARVAKSLGIPVFYYFPPSKWATDARFVADAARTIDFVAAPFVSTAKLYRDAGAVVEFVGNPLIDIVKPTAEKSAIRKRYGVENRRIVSILPGSREREIRDMLPILLKTAVLLNDRMKDTEFLMPITSSVFETSGLDIKYFKDHVKNWDVPVRIICDETYDVLSISDLSIITSGTATLEATCLGCPMVIVYKVSKATEWAARLLTHLPDYFGVPNLILGREAVPELLQESATPEMVSRACLDILDSPEKQQQIREDLTKVVRYLGKPGAGLRVAEHIRDML